jgi:YVTN family beta-propeller protein
MRGRMIYKRKLHPIALASPVIILMLISIIGARPFAYITNYNDKTASVIDTTTNTVTATVPVGIDPYGVAVTPDGTKVYVTNYGSNNVSVIDTATNNVTTNVPVGGAPNGIAVSSDGTKVYVANNNDSAVYVINTTTNTVITKVDVGKHPVAFGQFIRTQMIPKITWSKPAYITYGTALSTT